MNPFAKKTASFIKNEFVKTEINYATNFTNNGVATPYRIPIGKRLFDIISASFAILLLSPLLIIIAILIRLESKGPIIYKSKRVGTGYHTFDFYKFRSMNPNADSKIKEISHLNLYSKEKNQEIEKKLCDECTSKNKQCENQLFTDEGMVCGKIYNLNAENSSSTFIKIKDDPRVTRIGKFIRNTSIDELPQLFNVIKGDMSIVGNRPLPIYEAEKITTDKFALRYFAPAGITGLWQVTKRGRAEAMSEEERMALDNEYSKNVSFIFDIKIILKTFPSLLQKENV
jgi:lipopolysaccharide/colanic/teichoic acid biosynthesis glycosyltransferase